MAEDKGFEINKWCQPHWLQLRTAIESRGMKHLVPATSDAAARQLQDELTVGNARDREGFDPLMRAYWALSNRVIEWTRNPVTCPLCQLQQHVETCKEPHCTAGTVAQMVDSCSDSLREYVRSLGLLREASDG